MGVPFTAAHGSIRFSLSRYTTGAEIDLVLEKLPPVDMGDYRQVVNFVRWAKVNYPAKRYMLIIENHGDGWSRGRRVRIRCAARSSGPCRA